MANGARTLRCDALDCAQLPRVYADHFEYAVAEPFDSFGGTDRAEVGALRHQERNRSTSIDPVYKLCGPNLDLPAVLGMLGPGPGDAHVGAKRDHGRQI